MLVVPLPAAVLAGRARARQPQVGHVIRDPAHASHRPTASPDTKDSHAYRTPHHRPALRRRADQPPPVRLLRRAPRPLRLRRHLRARAPDGRRRGLPPGRHRARQRARRLDHPLPRRQLRLGLPLGGQRRPARGAPAPPRPRLALDRDERGRAARVLVVARQGRQRAHARRQPRHPRHARGARPARVLEHRAAAPRSSDQRASRTAAPSRSTCGCGASATRWTARGSSATARPTTTARSPRRPRRRCASSTRRLELVVCGSSSAHMPTFGEWERVVLEPHATTTSTTSRATPTTRSRTATSAASSPRRSTWTTSSRPSSRPPTTSKAVKGSDKTIDISFDEWNVWYIDRYHGVDKIEGVDNWPVAPRLLEDVYSVADAVVFGNLHDLAAQARRPGHERVARPARQRDRPDHDRARRAGLAADDLLPVRDHLAPRAGRGARGEARVARRTRPTVYGEVPARRRRRHARRRDRALGGLPREPRPDRGARRSRSTSRPSAGSSVHRVAHRSPTTTLYAKNTLDAPRARRPRANDSVRDRRRRAHRDAAAGVVDGRSRSADARRGAAVVHAAAPHRRRTGRPDPRVAARCAASASARCSRHP